MMGPWEWYRRKQLERELRFDLKIRDLAQAAIDEWEKKEGEDHGNVQQRSREDTSSQDRSR